MADSVATIAAYEIEIAMLEIYMEEVYNLLVPRSERAPLKVRGPTGLAHATFAWIRIPCNCVTLLAFYAYGRW